MEMPAAGTSVRCRYCSAVIDGPRPASADPLPGIGNLFEDRNGDGIPDVFESLLKNPGTVTVQQSNTRYTVNGVQYDNLEEIPQNLRAMMDHTRGLLDGMSTPSTAATTAFQSSENRTHVTRSDPSPSRSKMGMWLLFAVLGVILAGFALVVLMHK
jgi:hypothetical protein